VKYRIIVSPKAALDVDRLELWLLDKNPSAASRVGAVLEAAMGSLAELPDRGRPRGVRTRELNAAFGRSIYVIRYRVIDEQVIVTRVFHGRERR
jgi:plasmid stabilization system protein ParE